MDALSNVDRLVLLLRQRLEQRNRTGSVGTSGRISRVAPDSVISTEGLTGDLALAGAADDQLQRALVEQLLTDQFGAALVNDVRFQQVVDRVAHLLADDADMRDVLDTALATIRSKIEVR